jgi:DNA-binding NtrC family response regulator
MILSCRVRFSALPGGDILTILAFDDMIGLYELKNVLKELLGDKMHFRGFDSAEKVLKAAEEHGYDIVFADVAYQNRSGMLLLGELSFRFPRTNYIGAAAIPRESDAMTLHHLHGGYIIKPYDREKLADTLSNLRYPVKNAVQ